MQHVLFFSFLSSVSLSEENISNSILDGIFVIISYDISLGIH